MRAAKKVAHLAATMVGCWAGHSGDYLAVRSVCRWADCSAVRWEQKKAALTAASSVARMAAYLAATTAVHLAGLLVSKKVGLTVGLTVD